MYEIDDSLKEFIESPVAAVLGTASAAGRPHVTYCWGPVVGEDHRSVAFHVNESVAAEALADIVETGRIALTVADPITYRSVQLKGHCLGTRMATPEDEAIVQRHFESFLSVTSVIGDPPGSIRNLKRAEPLRRFILQVEAAFDQTPGPDAGRPL